jgi:ribonuclease BN (tRNA processing enzyme)
MNFVSRKHTKSEKLLKSFLALAVMASISSAAYADENEHSDKDKGEHSAKAETAFQKVEGDLSVMVLGSGGPMATAEGRASAGYLIFTDGKPTVLMDVGGGTYQRLAESGTNVKDLDIVLLSHLHADHTGDLTPVVKTIYFHNNLARAAAAAKGITLPGRTAPINIYGPTSSSLPDGTPGVKYPNGQFVYPATADYVDEHYSLNGGVERYLKAFVTGISDDDGSAGPLPSVSNFLYTPNDLPSTVPNATEQTLVLPPTAPAGLVIKSIAVDHGPVPAVAFRIEYKGHTVVYSGDTGTKGIGPNHLGQNNMKTISQGADLLIYDTAVMEAGDAPPNPLFHVLHSEPSLIADVAIDANVKTLVLSHLTPVTSPRINEVMDIIKGAGFTGKIKEAKDLKVYNLGDDD